MNFEFEEIEYTKLNICQINTPNGDKEGVNNLKNLKSLLNKTLYFHCFSLPILNIVYTTSAW